MAVADAKLPLFKDHFWDFQIKIKFQKQITRQGSVQLPDPDSSRLLPDFQLDNYRVCYT